MWFGVEGLGCLGCKAPDLGFLRPRTKSTMRYGSHSLLELHFVQGSWPRDVLASQGNEPPQLPSYHTGILGLGVPIMENLDKNMEA